MRWYNLTLSFVVFLWLLFKINHNWSRYPGIETRGMAIAVLMLVFSYVWGTSEQILQDTQVGLRIVVGAIAISTLFWVQWKTRGRVIVYGQGRGRVG